MLNVRSDLFFRRKGISLKCKLILVYFRFLIHITPIIMFVILKSAHLHEER